MIGLHSERIVLRQWEKSDFETFAQFFSLESNARFLGGAKSSEDSWRLMTSYLGHYELLGYSYLVIEDKTTKSLIGSIGIWNSEPWPEHEMGYWLLPESQGKGYGLEAGQIVKSYAFNEMKLDTLVSYIDPENTPSIRLAERLGGKYDETIELLEYGPHKVFRYSQES